MTTITRLLTNQAYGFPTRGAKRRIKAPILACIHITGNSRTAANPDPHQAALDERNYANRVGSNGPSAHYYVARDGWAVGAINSASYAAWSNGDVASPNTVNAGIAKVLALRAKGYNANEAYWLEFECVGYGSTYPITTAQKQFCAEQIAAMAKVTGLPVNRTSVHGHSDLNSVNRASCPCPKAGREAFLADVIARANAILHPPPTGPEEDDVPQFDAPRIPTLVVVPTGTWLYVTADATPDAGNVQIDPGRDMPLVGTLGDGTLIVAYVPTSGAPSTLRTYFAKPGLGVKPYQAADPTPFTQSDVDAAAARAAAETLGAARRICDEARQHFSVGEAVLARL